MKVLVTGASGFAGRHLIRVLADSHSITGMIFPDDPDDVKSELACDLLRLDIREEQDVAQAFERVKPDWIFHFAAVSNVRHSWEKPKETLDVNLIGALNLLEAAKHFSPDARILVVSSSDVYGIHGEKNKPFKEEDAVEAVNPYAFSKLCLESLCRFYVLIEDLDIVVTRSFPHTGPEQSADFVCSDWAFQIAQIEKKLMDPALLVGNTEVERDYSDVRDVIKAYTLLLKHGEKGEIYNVCSGRSTELKKILDTLLSYSSAEITVQVDQNKMRKTDLPVIVGSNDKIQKAAGWNPEIPLDQTLLDLLEYWRRTV